MQRLNQEEAAMVKHKHDDERGARARAVTSLFLPHLGDGLCEPGHMWPGHMWDGWKAALFVSVQRTASGHGQQIVSALASKAASSG
jgi:hypothetical protein